MRRLNPAHLLALLLAVAAFTAAAWTSAQVYERLPHIEDEMAYTWQARLIAERFSLTVPSPVCPKCFLYPFVIDYNGQRFGKYPPGWPALLGLAELAGIRWLANPLLAGLVVWLTYRLASRFLKPKGALLAAFLLASSPFFLVNSGSLLSHTWSLFLALAFVLAWLDSFTPGAQVARPLAAVTAGLCLGLLALTRPYTALALALPFAVHGCLILWRTPPSRRLLLGLGLLAGAVSLLLFLWQYAVTGSPFTNPYTLWWPYDKVGLGAGVGVKGFHTLEQGWQNTLLSLSSGTSDLFGWPEISYLLIPVGLFALRRDARAWLLGAMPLALVAAYLLYWIGAWLFGPRYYFEALPAAAILSAAGVGWLAGRPLPAHMPGRVRFIAVGLAIGLLVAGNLLFYLPGRLQSMRGLYQVHAEDLAPFQTRSAQRLPPTLVIVYPHRNWIEYGRLLDLSSPTLSSHFIFIINQGETLNQEAIQAFPERYIWPFDPDRAPQPASGPQ
jgi:4-amino-4-deoxy-L-arabinose transferase-like glycosyltransferase